LRRLEAEEVRDALLAVSGRLTEEVGGPSIPVTENGEGKAVFGTRKTSEGLFAGVADTGRDKFRRSIYVQSRRTLPLLMLETFDLPVMTPNCDQRRTSTVATQSLMFLNDETVWDFAEALAQRLLNEGPDAEARIARAYELLFSAEPTEDERASCSQFLDQQARVFREWSNAEWQERLKGDASAADLRALASLCQTLICTNRFLYVD
jgi:hypothetical protein